MYVNPLNFNRQLVYAEQGHIALKMSKISSKIQYGVVLTAVRDVVGMSTHFTNNSL